MSGAPSYVSAIESTSLGGIRWPAESSRVYETL